jgi:stress response protein YsnF
MGDSNKTIDQHQDIEGKQTQQQIVPVLKQDYSISKETSIKEAKIEKRLVNKVKTVRVPLVYEELYINDKKLKSVKEFQIFSAFKDKITSIANMGNISTASVEQSIKKKNIIENRGELIPLFSSSSSSSSSSSDDVSEIHREKERIIPLYEEQFEIIKKRVKVAEIVITKRRITEKKKVDIDIITEEVTLEYPDGRSERLS